MRRRVLASTPGATLLAVALLVAGWALTLWVAPWNDERVNDLFVYRSFAEPVFDGGLPYRDVAFEYPPLAAPMAAVWRRLGRRGRTAATRASAPAATLVRSWS